MAQSQTLVNVQMLAGLFNISDRRVQKLASLGIIPKAERGQYALIDCVRAYIAYLQKLASGQTDAPVDIHIARARLVRANAEKSEIELAIMRGDALSARDVERIWTDLVTNFRAKMLAIPQRLAPILAGETHVRKIVQYLKDDIQEALDELSRMSPPVDVNDDNIQHKP